MLVYILYANMLYASVFYMLLCILYAEHLALFKFGKD